MFKDDRKVKVYITKNEYTELKKYNEFTDYMAVFYNENTGHLIFSNMIYSDNPLNSDYVSDCELVVKTDKVEFIQYGF